MPFFERSAIDDLRVGPIEDTPFNYGTAPGVSTPSFSRQITAAFELENPLGVGGKAFIEQTGTFEQLESGELDAFIIGPGGFITPESFPPEQDYNIKNDPQMIGYEQLIPDMINSQSTLETTAMLNARRFEMRERSILHAPGFGGLAAYLIAGTLTPINVLPIGPASIAKTVGSAALKGAAAFAGFTVVEELIFHKAQQARELQESFVAIASATMIGSLFGPLSRMTHRSDILKWGKSFDEDIGFDEARFNRERPDINPPAQTRRPNNADDDLGGASRTSEPENPANAPAKPFKPAEEGENPRAVNDIVAFRVPYKMRDRRMKPKYQGRVAKGIFKARRKMEDTLDKFAERVQAMGGTIKDDFSRFSQGDVDAMVQAVLPYTKKRIPNIIGMGKDGIVLDIGNGLVARFSKQMVRQNSENMVHPVARIEFEGEGGRILQMELLPKVKIFGKLRVQFDALAMMAGGGTGTFRSKKQIKETEILIKNMADEGFEFVQGESGLMNIGMREDGSFVVIDPDAIIKTVKREADDAATEANTAKQAKANEAVFAALREQERKAAEAARSRFNKTTDEDSIVAEDGQIIDPNRIPDLRGVGAGVSPHADFRTYNQRLDDEALAPVIGNLQKLGVNPVIRMLQSPDLLVRELATKIAGLPGLMQNKVMSGKTPTSDAAEVNFKREWLPRLFESIEEVDEIYASYRGRADAGTIEKIGLTVSDIITAGRNKGSLPNGDLTHTQFRNEVGLALINGDQHIIPEVAAAAAVYRKRILEPLREAGEKTGIFTIELRGRLDDIEEEIANAKSTGARERAKALAEEKKAVKKKIQNIETKGIKSQLGGESFRPRIYRHDIIHARREEFKALIVEYLTETGLPARKIDKSAEETIERILQERPYQIIDDDRIRVTGSARSRGLEIEDGFVSKAGIAFTDFLENDAEALVRFYTRSFGTDVELVRKFGSITLKDEMDQVRANARARRDAATTQKEKKEIDNMLEGNLRDIKALRDRVRGTYGLPDDPYRQLSRFYRVMKQWNYLTMLGGVVISALPDVARLMMTEGFTRTFESSIKPFMKNMRFTDGLRMSAKEVKLSGTALDMVLQTRALQFADIGDIFGRRTAFERSLTTSSGLFSQINLLNPWNSAMKQWAGIVVSSRILETTRKWAGTPQGGKGVALTPESRKASLKQGFDDFAEFIGNRENKNVKRNPITGKKWTEEEASNMAAAQKRWNDNLIKEYRPLVDDILNAKNDTDFHIAVGKLEQRINKRIRQNDAAEAAGAEGRKNIKDKGLDDDAIFGAGGIGRENMRRGFFESEDEKVALYDLLNSIKDRGQGKALSKSGGKISDKDIQRLGRGGIGKKEADQIAAQFEKYGQIEDGVWLPNTAMWTDLEAIKTFRNALQQDVDRIIVTPGAADRPLWASSELGSIITQFKSFGLAAHNRVLLAGLQERDLTVLSGALMMLGMGAMVDGIKRWQYSDTRELSQDELLLRAIDRSGLLGFITDANQAIEKLTDNRVGLRPMLNIGNPFKPSTVAKAGVVFGPTGSMIARMIDIAADIGTGEMDKYTRRNMRRMLPMQNLIGFQHALNAVENSMN